MLNPVANPVAERAIKISANCATEAPVTKDEAAKPKKPAVKMRPASNKERLRPRRDKGTPEQRLPRSAPSGAMLAEMVRIPIYYLV